MPKWIPGVSYWYQYVWDHMIYWMTGSPTAFHLAYLIFALLATFSTPDWIGGCLFEIVLRSKVMKLVVWAIFSNASRLIASFALTFLIIYNAALISRHSFSVGSYQFGELGNICTGSFLGCVRDHFY